MPTRHLPTLLRTAAAVAILSTAAAAQSTRPALAQLDRETRELYNEVRASVVQVTLPTPIWLNELAANENPLNKWGSQLTPEMRQQLQQRALPGGYQPVNASVSPVTTQPSTEPAPAPPPSAGGSVTIVAPVRVGDGIQLRPVTLTYLHHMGLILDTAGNILVPLYVEKQAVGDQPLAVTLSDGSTVSAHFVGSDRLTNLTILRADHPVGTPAKVSPDRPADGSLVMVLAPNAPSIHLTVWTGGQQDIGAVVNLDGHFTGFARMGQFLELSDSSQVIDQLVQTGQVKRAQLGVWVQEIRKDDPERQKLPELQGRPALRILQTQPDTAAFRAGLRNDDLILTLAGNPVGDVTRFATAISRCNGMTELQILRAGQPLTIRVELRPQ